MAELRKVPLHRALTRPQLFAGGEREPMLMLGLTCFTLIFVGLSWFTTILALSLYVFGSLGLRQLAKSDALMTRVYQRHAAYAPFMTARATPWANARKFKGWS